MKKLFLFCKWSSDAGYEPIAVLDCAEREALKLAELASNTKARLVSEYANPEDIPEDASPFDLPTYIDADTQYLYMEIPIYSGIESLIRGECAIFTKMETAVGLELGQGFDPDQLDDGA